MSTACWRKRLVMFGVAKISVSDIEIDSKDIYDKDLDVVYDVEDKGRFLDLIEQHRNHSQGDDDAR